MKSCTICNAPIGPRTKSGLCRIHARGKGHGRHPRVKQCSVCETPITNNKSGMCKPCGNRVRAVDPEFRRRISEGQRRALSDPDFAERKRKVLLRNVRKAMIDPEKRKRAREIALEQLKKAYTPEAIERKLNAIREARGRGIDKRVAWCPPEYRALHRRNVVSRRMRAADSRAMIEKLIADRDALPHIDSALDWLRRLAPVQKLENGYRYGNAILSPGEVIARAKLRGWEPERWAA